MRKIAFLLIFNILIFGCFADSDRQDLALFYSQARYQEAISLCQKNFVAGREESFYLLNLALLYEETGRPFKAVGILKRGYARDKDQEILFHLGRLLCLSGKSKEAVSFLNKYIALDPKDKKGYFYLGLAYEDMGDTKKAISSYDRSLKFDEFFVLALLRLSDIYFKAGRSTQGITYLKKAKELDPSIKSIYKQLALSFFKMDDYALSFKESSKHLDMVGSDPQMQLVLDSSKERLGEDYFKKQRAKNKKARKAKKLKVSSYVADRNIPLVRVCIGDGVSSFELKSTEEADLYSGNLRFILKKGALYRLSVAPSGKTFRLSDAEDNLIQKGLRPPVSLRPRLATSLFGIFGITHAQGTYWSETLDNFFRRDFEIRIEKGKMVLINILNIEEYLYGVLPSEVSSGWPAHSLYAQAVVARTKALKGLGRYRKRGFDFYNTVSYQVYLGASKETDAARQAVDKTRGLVITRQGQPFDVYYSSNCGGHTRDIDSFEGILDSEVRVKTKFPLTPLELYRWLVEEPPVFCKVRQKQKSRFRWQRLYPKDELDMEGFTAVKRNVSGHIDSLRIKSSSGSQALGSEYKIRKALDDIRSSLFRLEVKYDPDSSLKSYIFWGAGFGHAKGLCQYGAKGMAERGYSYRHILGHYFPKAKLKKAY